MSRGSYSDDNGPVIDEEEGLKVFGNDQEIYQDMVARFQKMTFDEQMQKLADCMVSRNH